MNQVCINRVFSHSAYRGSNDIYSHAIAYNKTTIEDIGLSLMVKLENSPFVEEITNDAIYLLGYAYDNAKQIEHSESKLIEEFERIYNYQLIVI